MHMLRPLFIFLLLGSLAAAQTVRWQPAGGTLARGQVTDLVLIFDNCDPTGDVKLPQVSNLEIGPGRRQEHSTTSIINGRRQSTRLVYFAYPSRPLDDQPVVIPSFEVSTDQGPATVESVRFDVREATVGNTSIPISSVAKSVLEVGGGSIWAGEVAPVKYTLAISGRFRANIAGEPIWEPAPLVVEEWAQPTGSNQGTGQDLLNLVSYTTRGYISKPGTYALPSIQQLVNIGVPTAGIFQTIRAEQYAIASDSPQITVRPLPQPAPANFTGAVGSFSLTSKVVPETATIGEPVTWTLSLKGTGNWPEISGLPEREASRSFRVVQPDASRTTTEGKLFEGAISEDVVLIPTQKGEFTLGPVEWSFFNPQSGRYETLTAPATVLKIEGAIAPTPPVIAVDPNAATSAPPPPPINGAPPVDATPTPASPTAIPREPLPGASSTLLPLDRRNIINTAIGIVALFPLLWLILSSRHAVRHDAGRSARISRRQLKSLLTQLRSTSANPAKRDELLHRWQKHTAILWRTPLAAPTTQLFAGDETWTSIWQEADRALYGEDRELPADWVNRAEQALARKAAPRFPLFSILAPRNILPVLIAFIALVSPVDLAANQDAINAYNGGKFAAAEKIWREAVAHESTDWIAHHNLALALAQQNRWDEAGAHAAVAFVQNPRNPSVRWHLGYTLERSGYTPPIIGRFADPSWTQKFAQLASPAEWQWLLLAGLFVGVASLCLLLGHAYGLRLKSWQPLAWLGGMVAVLTMAFASFGLQVFGLTADIDAVLTWRATQLRSIPTDLNSEQQTSPLSPGSLAKVEKSFLGWRQLSFPNGQTGWVRKEELVPLWRPKQ